MILNSVREAVVAWWRDTEGRRDATYLVQYRKSGNVRPLTFSHFTGQFKRGEVIGR